jgi:hypothetical protein
MTLQLKQLMQVNPDGDRLYSTDKTGAYVASYNESGWGSPNQELSDTALLFIAMRISSKGNTYLTPVGTNYFYNPSANNTQENIAEFILKEDGHHRIYEFAIPISLDDITIDSTGDAIAIDQYYYYDGKLYQLTIEGKVEITEDLYDEMIADQDVVHDYTENVIYPNKMIALQDLYRKYRDARNCNRDDTDFVRRQYENLRWDIESVYNLFWTGLTIEAANLLDSLNNKYDGQST